MRSFHGRKPYRRRKEGLSGAEDDCDGRSGNGVSASGGLMGGASAQTLGEGGGGLSWFSSYTGETGGEREEILYPGIARCRGRESERRTPSSKVGLWAKPMRLGVSDVRLVAASAAMYCAASAGVIECRSSNGDSVRTLNLFCSSYESRALLPRALCRLRLLAGDQSVSVPPSR